MTEENYQSAVDLLNQRFGNQQQVISAHMDELLKFPVCSGDKPSQLRFVYFDLSRCIHVKDPSKRKDILTRDKRCYLCLRTGHITRDCKKQQNCRWCEGRHHQSICQRDVKSKTPENTTKGDSTIVVGLKVKINNNNYNKRELLQGSFTNSHHICLFKSTVGNDSSSNG